MPVTAPFSRKNNHMLQFIIAVPMALATMIGMFSQTQKQGSSPADGGLHDTITILQTADIHGQIMPHSELFWTEGQIQYKQLGGLAHIKTLFDAHRAQDPGGTIILDGGDFIQGSGIATLSKGMAFPRLIEAMGYDFLIPGNWEVVYGKEQMLRVLEDYRTPVIAANMYDDATGGALFPPYIVKTVKGLRLGFIGYNDPEVPIRQNPSFSKGMRFDQPMANLKSLVRELKDNQDVDMLFLVTHLGISKQFAMANDPAFADIDYILGNDTHERIRQPLQGKYARVTEPGAFGSFVGKLQLVFRDGELVDERYELLEVDPRRYPADPQMAEMIDRETEAYSEELDEVLGYTKTDLYRYFVVENPMDNLITDAARWKTGADISISNGFRFSPPIQVTNGRAPITRSDLWNMLPVNEKVKLARASGTQILEWLERELHNVFAEDPMERFGGWLVRFSGMELEFFANKPKGHRVASVKIAGQPLDPERLYTISACRREGEPEDMLCRLPGTLDAEVMDYTVHEALEAYLREKGTVAPVKDGRARALDLGDNVLSQLPGSSYHFH